MNACATPVNAGWSANLGLEFQYKHNRTVLARNRHEGPLRVQRAFYPESLGQCHVYLLHPPGGIVAGDSLSIQAKVGSQAHGLLTADAGRRCGTGCRPPRPAASSSSAPPRRTGCQNR